MKLLLPLFLLATFCIGVTRQTLAQDKGHDGKPTVTIDGKTIDSDASRQEIEKWAEQHAREWEKWGERLEQKMERWAQQQEKQWEGWAEQYSRQWEEWGSKLEAGEIDSQQMNELLDKNLKMLKEMPLDRLIDGALKESLGELKNAPLESLGELNELVGGALEQSLKAMEKEISSAVESELRGKLNQLKTEDLNGALEKLQKSLDLTTERLDSDADEKLGTLKKLLESQSAVGVKEKAQALEVLKRELADAQRLLEKQGLEKMQSAKSLQARAKELSPLSGDLEHLSKQDALRKLAEAEKLGVEAEQQKRKLAKEKESLERYYADLKREKANLSQKESEIDTMRSEIMVLRKEIERLKQKDRKDD